MNKFLVFLGGCVTGGLVTYYITKKRVEDRTNDEINEVRKYYAEKYDDIIEELEDKNKESKPADEKVEIIEGPGRVERIQNAPRVTEEERKADCGENTCINFDTYRPKKNKPYAINPDEFGNQEGYEDVTFNYYNDGVLTNEQEEPMSDEEIEKYIGWDCLKTFGDYVKAATYVRNPRLKMDFEILFVDMPYDE